MKAKILFLSLFLITGFLKSHAQEQPSAAKVIETAAAQAKKEKKKVLLMFHASWCSWCKKMDKQMASAELKKLFDDNYVITHLTVQERGEKEKLENPGAEELLAKYKADKSGIPFFVILDAKGNLLEDSFNAKGENLGCPATPEEVAEFRKMLKNTSKLTDKQLDLIAETFTVKK